MRMIDADALQENFIGECVGECAICIYNNGGKDEWKGCKLIDNAQEITPEKALMNKLKEAEE